MPTMSENKNDTIPTNISAEKLRIAMVKNNDMKLSELGKKVNISAPAMTNRFKRNNFTETDLRLLADALGYDVEITLVSRKDGDRI